MTNKVPNIRFKGFTDDWEQRKLGDVFDERSERASGNEELLSVTISNGVIRQIDSEKRNIASEDKSNYKVVKKGDVPYNSMRMWQGAVGTSDYDGIVSPAYTVLIPKNNCNGKFFMELFKKQPTLEIFKRWSQGLTSDTWNLKYPVLSTIPFMVPSVKEQEKIAEYFKSLDNLITLHQRKCEQTKELKKFMLQKMFPKKGEKNPEIRFPGFTDAWEQRKLSDIADRFDNLRVPITASERKSGDTPYYGANGIQDYVEGFTHDGEFILVAEDGANDLKNYPVQYVNGKVWVNNHAHVLQGKNTITDNKFLMNSIKNFNIEPFLVGGGRAKLNADVMMKLNILLPTFDEQEKIGSFFKQLDDTIALHQRKCEQLKELKKFMLQNMFPKKG